MKEEFLHWLWKNRLFDESLLTSDGSCKIEILTPGEYNRDSGPDFFNTRLIINGTEWAGNTEIHINASDWYRHGHHTDHSYDNVILHLVSNNDCETYTASGRKLVTARLAYDDVLWENYLNLVNNPTPLACGRYASTLDMFRIRHWLNSLAVDRLEHKSNEISEKLRKNNNDWEGTLYWLISRYFGFRVNTDPFEQLATRLPLKVIKKHADNLLQVESLLFGTAGMLDEALFREAINDGYYRLLMREYSVLRTKYSLQPVEGWTWKFHRLRPANFPTIRISQLAALLTGRHGLFSRILECTNAGQLYEILTVKASAYWNDHYIFGKKSTERTCAAGKESADLLIINAVVPLLFVYGRAKQQQEICERALDILESLPPEDNSLITDYTSAGIIPDSAFTTQALIELRTLWCRFHRCLDCHIGSSLIALGHNLDRSESLFLEP